MIVRLKSKVLRLPAMFVAVAGFLLGPFPTTRCCQASVFISRVSGNATASQPQGQGCCQQKLSAPQPAGFCPNCCRDPERVEQETLGEDATPAKTPCRCQLQPRTPTAPLIAAGAFALEMDATPFAGLVPIQDGQATRWQAHSRAVAVLFQRPVRVLYGIWRN
jgi:hypothetical protein